MRHAGDHTSSKYFYLHDRLGSVRQVIDSSANVVNAYTYDPWGLTIGSETSETFFNPYRFAGYFWDPEVSQYHCFRRQYDPVTFRFTSRDPVNGKFKEPHTLHVYLYCLNDPVNRIDPMGEFGSLAGQLMTNAIRGAVTGALVGSITRGVITRSWKGVAKGAIFGAIGGGVSGGLASISSAGYIFAVIENSPALQGMIAGSVGNTTEGLWNRDDLGKIFIRATVGAVGGITGGALGGATPMGGIPGGIAGGQGAVNMYNYFLGLFGDWPLLLE